MRWDPWIRLILLVDEYWRVHHFWRNCPLSIRTGYLSGVKKLGVPEETWTPDARPFQISITLGLQCQFSLPAWIFCQHVSLYSLPPGIANSRPLLGFVAGTLFLPPGYSHQLSFCLLLSEGTQRELTKRKRRFLPS